jgi:hypothetical protein
MPEKGSGNYAQSLSLPITDEPIEALDAITHDQPTFLITDHGEAFGGTVSETRCASGARCRFAGMFVTRPQKGVRNHSRRGRRDRHQSMAISAGLMPRWHSTKPTPPNPDGFQGPVLSRKAYEPAKMSDFYRAGIPVEVLVQLGRLPHGSASGGDLWCA